MKQHDEEQTVAKQTDDFGAESAFPIRRVISAEDASKEFKLTSGISGTITTTQEATGGITVGRQSWRQIR